MLTLQKHQIDGDAMPFVPKNYSIHLHQKIGSFVWNPQKITVFLTDRQKNGMSPLGTEMRGLLAKKQTLNATVLDYLLEHPYLIPDEWKTAGPLYFWGTIYKIDKNLVVRSLYWGQDRWCETRQWLGYVFGSQHPALIFKD